MAIPSDVKQRHKTIVDSLTKLKNRITSKLTEDGEPINLEYVEAWLKDDIPYLANLFNPVVVVEPKVYKDPP